MSFPPDIKKAYGLCAAVGARLGEKARADGDVVPKLRAPEDADAFRLTVRLLATGLVPDAVLTQFVEGVVTDDEWEKWRARLLVQVKMTRDGGKPAPGHEQGRGVGRP
jgi:hypothetical protein